LRRAISWAPAPAFLFRTFAARTRCRDHEV